MRSAAIAFALALLACLAGVAILGASRSSGLVYSPGVIPAGPIAAVAPGQRACQAPLQIPDDTSFDRVALTATSAGTTFGVAVLDDGTGRRLGSGVLRDVRAPVERVVQTGRVASPRPLRVCVTNRGDAAATIHGQPGIASPRSSATVDGKPIQFDLALELRTEPESLLSLLPTLAERASLFRAGWVTPGVYLVLALALLIGAPLLLMRALARAQDQEDEAPVRAQRAPEQR
jgi:hypothetical protein